MKTKIKHLIACKAKRSQVVSLAEHNIYVKDVQTGRDVLAGTEYKTCSNSHAKHWGCVNCGKVWSK